MKGTAIRLLFSHLWLCPMVDCYYLEFRFYHFIVSFLKQFLNDLYCLPPLKPNWIHLFLSSPHWSIPLFGEGGKKVQNFTLVYVIHIYKETRRWDNNLWVCCVCVPTLTNLKRPPWPHSTWAQLPAVSQKASRPEAGCANRNLLHLLHRCLSSLESRHLFHSQTRWAEVCYIKSHVSVS